MQDLDYSFNELSNYKRNTIKIQSMNKNSFTAGEIVEFVLPPNSLIDVSTFRWHFTSTVNGTGNVAPPRDCESYIDRLQCTSKGVAIENSFNNYNLLFKLLLNITCDKSVEFGQRSVYAIGEGETAGAAPIVNNCVVEKWLGFLGSANVVWTGQDMLGDLRLSITLAQNNIIADDDIAPNATYTLSNVYATVDVIQGSEVLQMAIGQLKSKPMLAFDNYGNYSQSNQSNVKFSVNSAHLNKVLVTIRDVNTFNVQGAQDALTVDSNFFFTERLTCDRHQLLIGDTLYPQYPADGNETALSDVMKAFGKTRDISVGSLIESTTYLNGRYCLAYNFEHLGDGSVLSGIDTRQIATGCTWSAQTLNTADCRVDIFPIYKSVLMFSQEGVMIQP
jgi:hypothetical protein